jgi:hypothetical protein
MKDVFEYKLTSLIFGLLKGWDITFAGHVLPIVINEATIKSFWRYLFNLDFLYSSRDLIHHKGAI